MCRARQVGRGDGNHSLKRSLSARAAGRRNTQIATDLLGEREVDLAMARQRRRPLGVEAPEAVVAALAKQLRAVLAQMALEIAAFNRR